MAAEVFTVSSDQRTPDSAGGDGPLQCPDDVGATIAGDPQSTQRRLYRPRRLYVVLRVKPGFHYPSWRPELTARVDGWPVSISRQHGPCWRARVSTSRVDSVNTARQLGPSTRVVETGLYKDWVSVGLEKTVVYIICMCLVSNQESCNPPYVDCNLNKYVVNDSRQ